MSLLVQGFLSPIRKDRQGVTRIDHVAVFDDGTIKIARARRYDCPRFHMRGWQWEIIRALPANVEFCGNYPALM
jgi:hypothetical protein